MKDGTQEKQLSMQQEVGHGSQKADQESHSYAQKHKFMPLNPYLAAFCVNLQPASRSYAIEFLCNDS